MNFDFRQKPINLKTALLAILLGILVGVVMITASGHSPIEIYSVLFKGAIGSKFAVESSIRWTTPLIFAGISAAIAFRGGMFNFGIEGQLYIGALVAALIGVTFTNLPGWIIIPLMLLSSMVAGMIWAAGPALIKVYLGGSEIVPALMLNYIAMYLTDFIVSNFFIASGAFGETIKTDRIIEQAQLPRISSNLNISLGFVLGLGIVFLFYILIKKSKLGYEMSMSGLNPRFANYGGINVDSISIRVMLLSGAIAGLCGAVEVMAIRWRFESRFSPDFGNDGILAALLGGSTPVGTLIGAMFMGFLKAGALSVERYTQVSRALATVIQGTIICFVSARYLSDYIKVDWIKRFSWFKRIHKGIDETQNVSD